MAEADERWRAYEKKASKRRAVATFSGAYHAVVSLSNLYLTPFFLVSKPTEVQSAGIRDDVDASHTPDSQTPREMELEGEEHIPTSIGWTLATFSSLSAFALPSAHMAGDATIRTTHHPRNHKDTKIRRSKWHGFSHHTSTHPSCSLVQMPLPHRGRKFASARTFSSRRSSWRVA
jgi:hypothetical protein